MNRATTLRAASDRDFRTRIRRPSTQLAPVAARTGGRRPRLLRLGASVLAVVLVAILIWATVLYNGAVARADDRAAAVAVADRVVDHLLALDRTTTNVGLDALVADTAGALSDQLLSGEQGLLDQVRANSVVATGQVSATGIASSTRDQTVVLVAARGTVSNTLTRNAMQPRWYRFRLTLARVGAAWKVSKLEFVA